MEARATEHDPEYAYLTTTGRRSGQPHTVEIWYRWSDGALWCITEADDPEAATRQREAEYRDQFANPYIAAARGYIDDVIDPRETRPRLINALDMLRNKRDSNPPKKHGNIPL